MRARHVVLATGVWAGELAAGVALRPSRGSHLLVPAGRLGDPRAAVNVPVPGERGRWVFALPRADGLVAIGLTDVAADGPIPDEPAPERRGGGARCSSTRARRSRSRSAPTTSRAATPACARCWRATAITADLSRRHAVVEDAETGALTVVGGKLTTYRAMAQDAVDRITDRPCRTHRLPLVGAAAAPAQPPWPLMPRPAPPSPG